MTYKRKHPKKRTLANKESSKPSVRSLQEDIRQIKRAIAATKKVANLPGMRSILTSLYGEKRFAENLLQREYPKLTGIRASSKESKHFQKKQGKDSTKSEKLKRGWRFVDAIKKNYSNDPTIAKMSKKQLRSELKKFREGRESRVPDIAWYNPSP